MQDPTRLKDEGTLERQLLSRLEEAAPPPGERERVGVILDARLHALGAKRPWFSRTAGVVGLACVGALFLGSGFWLSSSGAGAVRTTSAITPVTPMVEPASAPVPAASAAPVATVAVDPEPATIATDPRQSARPNAPPSARTTSSVAASAAPPTPSVAAEEVGSDLRDESALLARARGELRAGAPATALDTLADANKKFPNGALSQEREALTIEALSRSGHTIDARERFDAFARANPESPHTARLRRLFP